MTTSGNIVNDLEQNNTNNTNSEIPFPSDWKSKLPKNNDFYNKHREEIVFSGEPIPFDSPEKVNFRKEFKLNENIYGRPIFSTAIGKLGNWTSLENSRYIMYLRNRQNDEIIHNEFFKSKTWEEVRTWETFHINISEIWGDIINNFVTNNDIYKFKLEVWTTDMKGISYISPDKIIASGEFEIIN